LVECPWCPILVRREKIRTEGRRSVGSCAAAEVADSNREGRAIKRDLFGGNEQEACLIGEQGDPDGAWI
jgi:hypothetical protein